MSKKTKDIIGFICLFLLVGGIYGSPSTLGFSIGSGAEILGANSFVGLVWIGSLWFLYRKFIKK